MHENIARAMYYISVQLLSASCVAAIAWVLTSLRGASATTKYWIWVVTAMNFVVPVGAIADRLWAVHLKWAAPLGVIGGPIWDMTHGWTALALGFVWIAGAFAMLIRLVVRVRRELDKDQAGAGGSPNETSTFMAGGIRVSFDNKQSAPAVSGILWPRILLPIGIDQVLEQREFDAVLFHEQAHARRRDNLIRLVYEVCLCWLWFHPLIWLAGARMGFYRELSCDESVIRRAHGEALVSALAKLAVSEPSLFLQAGATSYMTHRLARLAGAPEMASRSAGVLMACVFAAVVATGAFETVAHTACCIILKH